MPAITSRTSNSAVVNDSIPLPKTFPGLPEPVKKRFPEMADWEESTRKWWSSAFTAITEFNRDGVTIINQNYAEAKNLRFSVNGLTAEIEEINEVIITNNEAFARRLITVSAMAGLATNIDVQGVPPGAPALNDYWIDNSNPLTPITYQWDGADWVEVTTPITAAAVAQEATARATADGFLQGKYTLTVAAGDVVTGMNITSASGPGTNISDVTFVAQNFKIYNSVTGVAMFVVDGTSVKLGDVFTVDTPGQKIFIGVGTFGDANTGFYVDDTGRFSLKDKFIWDGTVLTIDAGLLTVGDYAAGEAMIVGTAGVGVQVEIQNNIGDFLQISTTSAVPTAFNIFYFDNASSRTAFNLGAAGTDLSEYLLIYNTVIGGNIMRIDENGLNLTGLSTYYKVGGTQVVGAQGLAVADATGAGDVVAQLNTLLARLRAHGLIAT